MKSFVALLVVTLALTASAQSGCLGVASTVFNSSFATSVTAVLTAACQQCASGYLLSGAQSSTCTALTGGCMWGYNSSYCLVCQSTYVLNTTSNTCVTCGSFAATCTFASNAVTVATCTTGYFLLSGVCTPCTTTGLGTAASPYGVAGCTACTAAQITSTSVYITCSACTASTGVFFPIASTYVTVPSCGSIATTVITVPTALGASTITGTITGLGATAVNCASIIATATGNSAATIGCALPAAGYYCPSTLTTASASWGCTINTAITAGTTTAAGFTVVVATITTPVVPAGTTAGLYVVATGVTTPTACTVTTYVLVSGACYTVIAGCAVQTSSTACSAANMGFHLASVGANATVACTAGNPCSSGSCGSGLALNVSGNCITATTPIANCLVQNGTSSCAVCAANYATVIGSCGACPSSCAVCSSSTTCVSCNTNYVVSNGACSVKSTTTASAKALFAGLAFISMIFYYIF